MIYRATIGAVLFLLAGLAAFLTWGHDLLCLEAGLPAGKADAVVVLAGPPEEDRERVLVAVDLVLADEAQYLVLPLRHRALEWPWFVRKYRIKVPLREEQVVIGRSEAASGSPGLDLGGTFAEARKTLQIMHERGFRTAIVVSSCYHMRRARLAFERADPQGGVVFHFHPVDVGDPEEPGPWWLRDGYAMRVADEYVKLIAGYLFYR
jgi:hypothetical protein